MKIRLGLAQTRQTADFDANAASIFRLLDQAAAERVQLVCFPETQTVGYRVDVSPTDAPVPVARLEDLHGRFRIHVLHDPRRTEAAMDSAAYGNFDY